MKTKILALYFFLLILPFGCNDESSLNILPDANKIVKEFKLYNKNGFEANAFRYFNEQGNEDKLNHN